MPVTYTRDDASKRLTIEVVGEVGPGEFHDIVQRQADEDTWRYGVLYVADQLTAPDAADVREMVRKVDRLSARYGRRGPVAIVSSRVEVYGTARMYSMLSEQQQTVAVFRTRRDAEAWLTKQSIPDQARP
jgi:hypothetical protein